MTNPKWIYENLIIQGHLIVLPAPPNGGKTTILMHIAGQLAADYEVCYVNADVGSGDVKTMQEMADRKGFHLLLPDMKAGLSMDDVAAQLEKMNRENADYNKVIFIFDTLKKMVDVISKSKAKELYKTLRGLTAKGMTIILLAHTNKYRDADGKYVYEGTGDLRADVDELIYLIPKKNDDGSMTVSTDPDKVRGIFEPITFCISADRVVRRIEGYVDTASQIKAEKQLAADATIIEAITEAIQKGKYRQTEIVNWCHMQYDYSRRTTEPVLKRYMQGNYQLWRREKALQNNAWLYELVR